MNGTQTVFQRHYFLEILELRAKFQIAMVSCSRFIRLEIPVTTGGFELRNFCIQSSYLTRSAIRHDTMATSFFILTMLDGFSYFVISCHAFLYKTCHYDIFFRFEQLLI